MLICSHLRKFYIPAYGMHKNQCPPGTDPWSFNGGATKHFTKKSGSTWEPTHAHSQAACFCKNKGPTLEVPPLKSAPALNVYLEPGGGGVTQIFFSGRGVRPEYLKCGACELIFASERGVLWTEMGPLRTIQERREKGVFRAALLHAPFLGQCPTGLEPTLLKFSPWFTFPPITLGQDSPWQNSVLCHGSPPFLENWIGK